MSKKTKRITVKPASTMNTDINVTPLVDVVLVLLIIFMVVTPLLEKDIPLTLPSMEKVEEVKDVPPDQLVVHIAESGDLKVNFTPVDLTELSEKLKDKLVNKAPNDKVVFVVADDKAAYSRLVAVLDAAKLAGAQTLGMATDVAADGTPGEGSANP
jgi:biopolymer transport protein ExbD